MKRQYPHVWKWRILHEDGIVNVEVKMSRQVLHMILAFENAQSEKEAIENAHFTEDSTQRTFTHHRMREYTCTEHQPHWGENLSYG